MTSEWKKAGFIMENYSLNIGSDHEPSEISANVYIHNGKCSEIIVHEWNDLNLSSFQLEILLKLFETLKKEGKIDV